MRMDSEEVLRVTSKVQLMPGFKLKEPSTKQDTLLATFSKKGVREAKRSQIQHGTDSFFSSPDAKMFLRCKLMLSVVQSNRTDMAFWVAQMVSS